MSFDEKAFREQQERLMAENVLLRAEVARLRESARAQLPPVTKVRKAARCGRSCKMKEGHPPLLPHHIMSDIKAFRCRPTKRCQENCYTGHCLHCGWQQHCDFCKPRSVKK